jgi:MFS family permease
LETLRLFLPGAPPPMEPELRFALSLMMFLQFAIWGAWFVVLGNYLNSLGFSRKEIARVYATMPIGAIIAPMFAGMIADRYFATQYVMAFSHLVGGVLLLWLAQVRTPKAFFAVALAYAIVYSPTLSLVNAVYFRQPVDPDGFPYVRVFGTIGWIVAGMSLRLFIKPGQPVNNRPILIAALFSIILGAYSFALPHTPPGAEVAREDYEKRIAQLGDQLREAQIDQAKFDSERTIAEEKFKSSQGIPFLMAIGMFRDPQAAIFFIGSLIIAMAMAVYFAFAALYLEQGAKVNPENIGPVMTIGQWVEIYFMLTLSQFIKVWGMKSVLLIGMAAWALRFAIFSTRPVFPLIVVAVGLHGICFDFFFAAGMMHTEKIAPPGITASAQALYGVLVYGLGMWLGTELAGWLNQRYTRETVDPATGQIVRVTDWQKFWIIPCIGVVASLAVFVAFFQA